MSPDLCISALNDALAAAGEDVTLRRVVSNANVDVQCRALVRNFRLREDELVSGVMQAVILATLSPSEIIAASWPGASPSSPQRLDRILIKGRWYMIDTAEWIAVENVIVRYDLRMMG